jgi:hypothetical protein
MWGTSSRNYRKLGLCGVALTFVSVATKAQAQDQTAQAIYSDVKDVISDVITTAVAQEVAPKLACLSGRQQVAAASSSSAPSPGATPAPSGASTSSSTTCPPGAVNINGQCYQLEATRYFPGSIQLIYNQNFGGLRASLLREGAELVGDIVYGMLAPADDLAVTVGASASATPSAAGSSPTTNPITTAMLQAKVARRQYTQQIRLAAHSQAQQRLPLLAPAPVTKSERASKNEKSPAPASTAGSALTFEVPNETDLEDCASSLESQLDQGDLGTMPLPLDQECAATNVDRNEYACDIAYSVTDSLEGDSADSAISVERSLAEVIGELVKGSKPLEPLGPNEIAAAAPIVTALLSGTPPPATSIPPMPAAASAATSSPATTCSQSTWPTSSQPLTVLQAYWLLQDVLVGTTACPSNVKDVTYKHINGLVSEWKLAGISGTARKGPLGYITGAMLAYGELQEICSSDEGKGSPVCDTLSKVQALFKGKDYWNLWGIINSAANGDLATAASRATAEIFRPLDHYCSNTGVANKDACTLRPYYERFTETVVQYTVQAVQNNGPPTEATREAFRDAATQLILQVGKGGGINRPFGLSSIMIPDVDLRYSWSPTYANVGEGSGHVLASVPWLSFSGSLVRKEWIYAGINVSLVDLLAPVAELATRPGQVASYTHQSRIYLNFLKPRFDVTVAVPALSTNLLAGAGISYEWIAPFPTTSDYTTCWDKGTNATALTCFEFGVFARYKM